MLVNWRYRERNSFIQRLDPRTRIIFMLCVFFAILPFWDLRFVLFFFALGLGQLLLARLTWQETRRFWLIILFIMTVLSLATAVTGRGGYNIYTEEHPLWQTELQLGDQTIRPQISAERLTFLVTQIIRFFTFASLAVPIPFTIHPARFGIAFRQLGVPDKFAFATDLAFRFIPSLGQDFQMTLDAQRARGYELERMGAGLVQQVRNMAPLMIPLVVGSIVRSEEIIDAMDLRGFGARPRTWLEELRYNGADYAVILFSVSLLLGAIVLSLWGYGRFWAPPMLLSLAGAPA
jgi:energy-coupling factor transport system permease protein